MVSKFKAVDKGIARAIIGLVLGASAVCAMAQQGVTDTEILLGEVNPLSGISAVGSLGLSAGTKLAVAEANAEGGVNGRKLRLISEDDGGVVARAIQSMRKLLTSDKVFALTSTSGAAQSAAMLPQLKEAGVPAMNYLSFPESFHTPVVPNIFVSGATHQDTTEQMATQMAKRFPGKKFAIIMQDDELGFLMTEGFERAQKKLNLQLAYSAKYKRGTKDFSAEILAAVNAGAEILLTSGIVTENIAMAKELERLGKKMPMVVSWVGRYRAVLEAMGPAAENLYLVDYVTADESAQARAFKARASKYLPEDETKRMNRFSYTGYAGTKILIEAMRRCGKTLTWACTIKQLDGIKEFDTGVMEPVSYSPKEHFAKQPLTLMKANTKTLTFQLIE